MYGRKNKLDVILFNVSEMENADAPADRFITIEADGNYCNNNLLVNEVVLGDNLQAILANTRYVPFRAVNKSDPIGVTVQNDNHNVFGSGGTNVIPTAGLWGKLFDFKEVQ